MMITDLLHSLYRAFDKDPHPIVGMHVEHEQTFSWVISDRRLTITQDIYTYTYALESYTLDSLRDALEGHGFTVLYINESVHLSTSVLLDGSGTDNKCNMLMYSTVLYSILDAYALELELAETSIHQAIAEIIYTTADGEFLDFWGNYWGFPRIIGEQDNAYRDRTIDEITRKRSNPIAIEQNIYKQTQVRHKVREPWKEFMTLSDDGNMSQDKHLTGLEWQYHTAQVVGWGPTLGLADSIARRDRPAGTLFIDPQQQYPGSNNTFPNADIISWEDWLFAYYVSIGLTGILSENLVLSGFVDDFTAYLAISDLLLFSNSEGLNLNSSIFWNVFCKGEIVLSDSDPLESLQAHFGGTELKESGGLFQLSDIGNMSDSDYKSFYVPIDLWVSDDRSFNNAIDSDFISLAGRQDIISINEITFLANVSFGWSGSWNTRHWQELINFPVQITNIHI